MYIYNRSFDSWGRGKKVGKYRRKKPSDWVHVLRARTQIKAVRKKSLKSFSMFNRIVVRIRKGMKYFTDIQQS
jgi:hypothetical protein